MNRNISDKDKVIRVFISAGIATLYYYDIISGVLAYFLMGLVIVLLISSLLNFCPIYKLLGINTNNTK